MVRNLNSDFLSKVQHFEERLREQNRKNVARDEREYASQLHMAGRKAYFDECLRGIKLEEQQLPKIGPFDNIVNTYNFMFRLSHASTR